MRACKESEIPVSRRTFTLEELKCADEAIVTSSGVPCTPCERLDGVKIGGRDGKTLEKLQDILYMQYEFYCAMDGR